MADAGNIPLKQWTHLAFNWNGHYSAYPDSGRLSIWNGQLVKVYEKLDGDALSRNLSALPGEQRRSR